MLTVFAASLCADDELKPAALFSLYSFFNSLLNFLVAPLTIGEKSIVGAGSVITKDVSKKSLALTRSQQLEIKNYKRKSQL